MRPSLLLLTGLALIAPPAPAVLIDSGTGSENTSAPPSDPGWANVGSAAGLTAVYLGNGWVLSASHVGFQDVEFGGTLYAKVPGSYAVVQLPGSLPADLAVWRISPIPPLPAMAIRSVPPVLNSETILIGRGQDRGAATTWNGIGGYEVSNFGSMRWGTNRVLGIDHDVSFSGLENVAWSVDFTAPPPGLANDGRCSATFKNAVDRCPESQARPGDSGGAAFLRAPSGTWELAGILFLISTYEGQPLNYALYGNLSYAVDLATYRAQIDALITDPCAQGADTDADGTFDACDNCTLQPNADQTDADADGYGNACDGDFDQSPLIGIADLIVLRDCFNLSVSPGVGPPDDPDCAESDMNASGAVNISDFSLFRLVFGRPPGPSALAP